MKASARACAVARPHTEGLGQAGVLSPSHLARAAMPEFYRPSLRGAQRRSNPCLHLWRGGLLRCARYDSVGNSARNPHRQVLDPPHKARIAPLRLADHFDAVEALQHFLPDDLELQLGEPHADAAVDAEAERQMGAGPRAVDDELVRLL